MWFWLAILSMLMWSGSDLFSKIGSRPDDRFSHWKMVMAVGLVMGLHAAWQIFVGGVEITFGAIIQYLPASAMYIGSMVLGYVALRYIELSVSSPICNCSGAAAALMCFIFLGETLVWPQTVAIVMICMGVMALGFIEANESEEARLERRKESNVRYTRSALALILPIAYCILDAAGTFADIIILETMDEGVANVAYELTFFAMAVFAFIYTVVIHKQPIARKTGAPMLTAAVFETAGQFAYVYAIGANAMGAAPIISSYCIASVLWSRIFLKEKLSWKHYAAIAVAVVGIIVLGIYDEM